MKIAIGRHKNKRIKWSDVLICLAVILSPIFQHHKGFYINAGWSVLVLAIPLCLLKYNYKRLIINKSVLISFTLILAYYMWQIMDHGFSAGNLIKVAILFAYYLLLISDRFNYKYFIYISSAIILIATCSIVVQYICYYIFHFKLQFLRVETLLDTSTRWFKRISSTSVTGLLYRPSAFFLEPSHMFIFSFPSALYMIFSGKASKSMHILGFIMVAGILLTTSGMGITFSLSCIIAYYVMYKRPKYKEGSLLNFFMPRNILFIVFGIALLIYLYNNVEIVYRSLVRILYESDSGYNAIEGRTRNGMVLLQSLSRVQYIIGVTDAMGDLGNAVSAFQATMYKYGAIGILLSYGYYMYSLLKTTNNYRLMCVIIIVISFFCAHTHNYFYMLYYAAHIFEGLKLATYEARQKKASSMDAEYNMSGKPMRFSL